MAAPCQRRSPRSLLSAGLPSPATQWRERLHAAAPGGYRPAHGRASRPRHVYNNANMPCCDGCMSHMCSAWEKRGCILTNKTRMNSAMPTRFKLWLRLCHRVRRCGSVALSKDGGPSGTRMLCLCCCGWSGLLLLGWFSCMSVGGVGCQVSTILIYLSAGGSINSIPSKFGLS